MTIILAKQISKEVQSGNDIIEILSNISLSVKPGEKLAILGASGSGKSTLLSLLAGLDQPTRGQIKLFGEDLTLLDEEARAKLRLGKIGFVFQAFHLLPHLTALENVMLPLFLSKDKQAFKKARDMLEEVGLSHRMGHFPSQLSGGEQQRVAIARAFIVAPKILFADEPTGNLDNKTGQMIMDKIFSLNEIYKTTLVLVTHEMDIAKRCVNTIKLADGKMIVENK